MLLLFHLPIDAAFECSVHRPFLRLTFLLAFNILTDVYFAGGTDGFLEVTVVPKMSVPEFILTVLNFSELCRFLPWRQTSP